MVSKHLGNLLSIKEIILNPSKLPIKDCIALILGKPLLPFEGQCIFEDPEDAKEPFSPHYDTHIRPHVETFEAKRIAALEVLQKRLRIGIAAAIVIIILTIFGLITIQNEFPFIVGFMGLSSIALWCYAPIGNYKTAVKEKIFPHVFSFYGDDYLYQPQGLLSASALEPSGIIPHYTKEYTEDYIKGTHNDVILELTEARMTKTSGSGKSRRTVTVFKGVFVRLSMNKNFAGKTIVKRDRGMLANWLTKKTSDLSHVALEDVIFEEKFEVYSSDQVEARYLLTTAFMDRLLKLSKLFDDKGIQCSFYEDHLLMMIPSTKNRFETASIFTPATFQEDINTILKEMSLIFQIIDILKLDVKTGV